MDDSRDCLPERLVSPTKFMIARGTREEDGLARSTTRTLGVHAPSLAAKRAQGVEDHGDVDHLLEECTGDWRQVTEGCHDHR